MIKNPTINGFELALTTRVLCSGTFCKNHIIKESFKLSDLLSQASYDANDILRDCGLEDEMRMRIRGKKAFLFCKLTERILAEVAVAADKDENGLLHKPRFILLNRFGFVKAKTIGDLLIQSLQSKKKGAKR